MSANSAHAQDLKDPVLLARYDQLTSEGPGTEGMLAGFEAFATDYIEAALSAEAPCLFGCNSGFSGDGPDYTGAGYREFLARADLVLLARKLELPANALRHLERAKNLLEAQWNLHSIVRSSSESGDRKLNVLVYFGWTRYEGCSGLFPDPAELAVPLLHDIEQLRLQRPLLPDENQKLDYIDQALKKISAQNE